MNMKTKNDKLPHMINLVIGDWSGDGHSKAETVTILSNLTKKDVEKAYKNGTKKVDCDITLEVASSYEDNIITKSQVHKLATHGYDITNYSDYPEDDDDDDDESNSLGGYHLYTDGFASTWLFVAKVGNPDFEYEITENDSPNINIGGYGLFE